MNLKQIHEVWMNNSRPRNRFPPALNIRGVTVKHRAIFVANPATKSNYEIWTHKK